MVSQLKSLLNSLVPYILVFVIGFCMGGWVFYDHMKPELVEAKAEIKALRLKYESTIAEKEAAKIELALKNQKENAKVGVESSSTSKYAYTEKTKPSDPDVKVTVPEQKIKIAYNNEIFELPMKRTTITSSKVDGTLSMTQESVAVLDVTDIVNREIANKIMSYERRIAVSRRKNIQNAFWGSVVGAAAAAVIDHSK